MVSSARRSLTALPLAVQIFVQLQPCAPDADEINDSIRVQISGDGLEEGTYAMPFGSGDEQRAEITSQELSALLSGIDLSRAKRRKRYRLNSLEDA